MAKELFPLSITVAELYLKLKVSADKLCLCGHVAEAECFLPEKKIRNGCISAAWTQSWYALRSQPASWSTLRSAAIG